MSNFPATTTAPAPGTSIEPLWREVLGHRLRTLRLARGERLVETARRAGISPQYLSEIERGRKEPSSEMVAAVSGALDLTLADLMARVAGDLRRGPVVVDLRARRCDAATALENRADDRFVVDSGFAGLPTVLAFAA